MWGCRSARPPGDGGDSRRGWRWFVGDRRSPLRGWSFCGGGFWVLGLVYRQGLRIFSGIQYFTRRGDRRSPGDGGDSRRGWRWFVGDRRSPLRGVCFAAVDFGYWVWCIDRSCGFSRGYNISPVGTIGDRPAMVGIISGIGYGTWATAGRPYGGGRFVAVDFGYWVWCIDRSCGFSRGYNISPVGAIGDGPCI